MLGPAKTPLRTIAIALLIVTCVQALTLPNFPLRQPTSGDGHGGEGYTVAPLLSDEKPATAILVHGLGGTGEEWGFVSLALSFFSLNYVKFVIPTAPTRFVSYMNETLPSWYDIFTLKDFASRVNRTQLLASVDRINNIIIGERAAGVASSRIFLIGFSQGGGVALTTFLRSAFKLAGCIGVATWLPLDDEYPANLSPKIKDKHVMFIHGTADEAVSISYATRSANRIQKFGAPVNLTSDVVRLEGEKHLIVTSEVMTLIEDYISSRANGTTRFLVKMVKEVTQTFGELNAGIPEVRQTVLVNRTADDCYK